MINRARSRSRPAEPPISHASISVVKPLPPKNSQERRMQFGNNEKRANPYQADRMIPPVATNKNDPRLKRRQEEDEKKQQIGAKHARTSICISPAVPNEQSFGAKQARTSICVSQVANPCNNIPYEELHKQQRQIGAKRARTSISISPAANPRNNIPNDESTDSHSPTPSDSNFEGLHQHEKRRRSMPSSTQKGFADWFQQGKQIAHRIEQNIDEYSVREGKVGKLQTSFSQFLDHVNFLCGKE